MAYGCVGRGTRKWLDFGGKPNSFVASRPLCAITSPHCVSIGNRCPQPRARLPLLPTRLPITFPAAAHHRTLAGKIGTKCFTVNFIAAAPTVVRYSVIPQAITSRFMPRRDSNNKKNFIVFASYSDYATYLFISWT